MIIGNEPNKIAGVNIPIDSVMFLISVLKMESFVSFVIIYYVRAFNSLPVTLG